MLLHIHQIKGGNCVVIPFIPFFGKREIIVKRILITRWLVLAEGLETEIIKWILKWCPLVKITPGWVMPVFIPSGKERSALLTILSRKVCHVRFRKTLTICFVLFCSVLFCFPLKLRLRNTRNCDWSTTFQFLFPFFFLYVPPFYLTFANIHTKVIKTNTKCLFLHFFTSQKRRVLYIAPISNQPQK